MIELLYFTGKDCGVCQVLKPKLLNAVERNFPDVKVCVVDVADNPTKAGQHMVFTLPVVILKLNDVEVERFARSFSVHQVLSRLERQDFELKND